MVLAGLDVGGSKLAIRVETLAGDLVAAREFAAGGWCAEPAGQAAAWLLEHLARTVPEGSDVAALGVGAQGCNSLARCTDLERALAGKGWPSRVVNDGALLVPAAGLEQGIGIVAGTGSIGVGTDTSGNTLLAGGWGWVLGDEGSGPALVRDAARAALRAHDQGEQDDGLLTALISAFAVQDAERLARAVNDEPTPQNWGPRAPAVFAAADAGSRLAMGVISDAAAHLSALVTTLIRRGAAGSAVVAAGSVIVHQPRLAQALRDRLAAVHPGLELRILRQDPVTGAVTLARRPPRAQAAPGPGAS